MRLAYGLAAGVVLGAAFIAWRFLPARAPTQPVPGEAGYVEPLPAVTSKVPLLVMVPLPVEPPVMPALLCKL